MDRSAHRANVFAGSVLALHAEHDLVVGFGILEGPAEVGVHANPVHFAAPRHLVLADHSNVILRLARHNAGITPYATV